MCGYRRIRSTSFQNEVGQDKSVSTEDDVQQTKGRALRADRCSNEDVGVECENSPARAADGGECFVYEHINVLQLGALGA
jgi:hypothetical protein